MPQPAEGRDDIGLRIESRVQGPGSWVQSPASRVRGSGNALGMDRALHSGAVYPSLTDRPRRLDLMGELPTRLASWARFPPNEQSSPPSSWIWETLLSM